MKEWEGTSFYKRNQVCVFLISESNKAYGLCSMWEFLSQHRSSLLRNPDETKKLLKTCSGHRLRRVKYVCFLLFAWGEKCILGSAHWLCCISPGFHSLSHKNQNIKQILSTPAFKVRSHLLTLFLLTFLIIMQLENPQPWSIQFSQPTLQQAEPKRALLLREVGLNSDLSCSRRN